MKATDYRQAHDDAEAESGCAASPCTVTGRTREVRARKELEEVGDRDDAEGVRARQRYKRALEVADRKGAAREVWAARVGEMAFVGLPGEILVEIGMQIKQRSPFPVTSVISMANGDAQ